MTRERRAAAGLEPSPSDAPAGGIGPDPVPPTPRLSLWSGERRALTLGLALTVTLAALESLAVATAMPVVARELGGLELYGWVFSSFFLGDLIGIVIAGQMADERDLARPFLLGLLLFAAGLVGGGLAPTMPVLVVARLVQGIGAGAIPAVAYVSIGRQYPPSLRPQMFAIMSTAWLVPGLVGPGIAGIVADHMTWRAIFLGLLPFVAIAAVLTLPSLAAVPGGTTHAAARDGRDPDPPGDPAVGAPARGRRLFAAVRVAIGASLVLAALDARNPVLLVALAVPGLLVGLPALRELLPVGALRGATGLPATTLLRGVLTFGFTGAETFIPLMLVSLRGTSASAAGLSLTASTVTWTMGSWIQSRTVARVGPGRLIRSGLAIVALGILVAASVTLEQVPAFVAVAAWGVTGLGMGLAYAPITLLVLHLAPAGAEGAATSGLQLSDVLGTALGAGVAGAIVAFGAASGWGPAVGLRIAFALAIVAIVAALGLTVRLGPEAAHGGAAGGR